MFSLFRKKRIYLDHASTTPLDPRVFSAMADVMKRGYYNPGGLYREGVVADEKIDECRKSVAKLVGTTGDHVVFTRGGTEGNNLAILGVIQKWGGSSPYVGGGQEGVSDNSYHPLTPSYLGGGTTRPHVIVSEIEHASVLETVRNLERQGVIELSLAPVTREGIVDVDELKKLLKPATVLVSIMYANNEIGTVQPIKEIAKLLRWYKKQKIQDTKNKTQTEIYPLFHTDAIQAANYLDINVERLGVDLMTLSGSKVYGPKSSGILYVRNKSLIAPLLHGGDQEMGLRAGTEDIAQVVGFAEALRITREIAETESARLGELQNYFFAELKKNIPGIVVNGEVPPLLAGEGLGVRFMRLPNNINISIPGISGERIIIELDARGICASSKSACKEDEDEVSHVIAAIRKTLHPSSLPKGEEIATEGSVRFSMGRGTTKSEVKRVVFELAKIINKIKKMNII